MNRLKIFLRALFWHISHGCPKSSISIIKQRFEICKNCDFYDKLNQQCLQCGCNINDRKMFLNKLAWLDQKCPLNKW